MSLPLPMLKGSLSKKLEEAKQTNLRLVKLKGVKDSSVIDKLLEKRVELELDIDRHLLNKERIEDPLLDYCFTNFCGHSYMDCNKNKMVYFTVFNKIPAVEKFTAFVKKYKGQKIATTTDGKLDEVGLISGDCEFLVRDDIYRYLIVPVNQVFARTKTNGWTTGKEGFNLKTSIRGIVNDYVYIERDIFSYPGSKTERGVKDKYRHAWTTDYTKERYIGGGPPPNTGIYIGDKLVEDTFRKVSFGFLK